MQRAPSLTVFLCLAIVALLAVACARSDERMYPIGPEVTADLIVYFKSGVSQNQINDFWQNVLSYPDPNGRGYYHRPGVGMLGSVSTVEGHEGVSINFFSNATDAERADLRRRVNESPLVFTVLESVAPRDVETLKRH